MKWNEARIIRAVGRDLLESKCVVLVDRCSWTGNECDVLAVTKTLRVIDVEVKISRSDLKADAKKEKWWRRQFLGWTPPVEHFNADGFHYKTHSHRMTADTALTHPRKVWKHYYCMPSEIWNPDLLASLPSPASGVVLIDRPAAPRFKVIRRATPAKDPYVLSASEAIDVARLANLRMWDAYLRLEQEPRGLPRRPLTRT